MVVTLSDNDLMRMKAVLLDEDREEALQIIRELVNRLQIQVGKRAQVPPGRKLKVGSHGI